MSFIDFELKTHGGIMKKFLSIFVSLLAIFFLFASCAADSGNDDKGAKSSDGGDGKVYYTLVLNANGGEGSISYSNILANQEFVLETAQALGVSREGYSFVGWARNSSATTANYADGGKVIVNSNITLYAVWSKNSTPETPDEPENPNPENPNPENPNPENPASDETVLSDIVIITPAQKTEYTVGDSVELTALVVKARYSDGSTKTLGTADFDYSPKTLSSSGSQSITISYQGKTTSFSINVSEPVPVEVVLTDLTFVTEPTQKSYVIGDSVDVTGAKLLATYSDGSSQEIESGFTVSPEVLNASGNQLITLSYETKTVTYSVEVINALNFSLNVIIHDFTDETNLLTYDEGSKTFIAKDAYKEYSWWIDNSKITNSNGFCKITQDLVSDKLNHTIMVVVKDDDNNRYSATAEFSIR